MSIKKKFVTAVATAGLLAGLFGSALVPSVFARGADGNAPHKTHTEWWVDNPASEIGDSGIEIEGQYLDDALNHGLTSFALNTDNGESGEYDLSIGFALRDKDDAAILRASLSATSTGFVEVAWALRAKTQLVGSFKTRTCDSTFLDNEAFGLIDTVASAELESDMHGDGAAYLCIRVKDDTKPGAGTITVKANGVTLAALPFTLYGDLASLTLSVQNGYASIAEGNAEQDRFFRVVGKDSAGQVINAQGRGHDQYLNDYTNNAITEAGDDAGSILEDGSGDAFNFVDNSFDYTQALDLNADVCDAESFADAGDADAGHSYAAALEMENWGGDIITSNSVTISCTGPESDAVLSNIVAETATGEADWAASDAGVADADGMIAIYATVKDGAGRSMGLDDTIGFDVSTDALYDSDLDLDDANGPMVVGGKMMIGYIVPDMLALAKYAYEFTVVDTDLSDGSGTGHRQPLVKTLYYTAVSGLELDYSLTRVRNAAKTVATWTADYGVSCSNARISFDWENADATKYGSVTRRANIDGVAVFSLARRNTTIYVYASGCDNFGAETDPVKARFR